MKLRTAKMVAVVVSTVFLLGYTLFFSAIHGYATSSSARWFWTSKIMATALAIAISTVILLSSDLLLSRLR